LANVLVYTVYSPGLGQKSLGQNLVLYKIYSIAYFYHLTS
jgi:hypothetical protein